MVRLAGLAAGSVPKKRGAGRYHLGKTSVLRLSTQTPVKSLMSLARLQLLVPGHPAVPQLWQSAQQLPAGTRGHETMEVLRQHDTLECPALLDPGVTPPKLVELAHHERDVRRIILQRYRAPLCLECISQFPAIH